MRHAKKALIASILAGACLWAGVLAVHADPAQAYVPGPLTVEQAQHRVESARIAVRRAKARLREARRVLAETRRITASYGSDTGRWVLLAMYVGWPRHDLDTLGMLIQRESNGDPKATNPTTGCAGLLQVHPVHGLGERAYIPYTNLKFGLKLYREQGTAPWGI